MDLELALPVHEKTGIQHPNPFFSEDRRQFLLQPLICEDAVLQLLRRAADHIRKCIHLYRTALPAARDTVHPYDILSGFMKTIEHLPQKARSHDTSLHQLPLRLRVELVSILIHCCQNIIPHLVSVDKILSPAPVALLAFAAHPFPHPHKHSLDLFIRKSLTLFLQPEKCPGELLQRLRVFFYLFHIRAPMQCLSFIHTESPPCSDYLMKQRLRENFSRSLHS